LVLFVFEVFILIVFSCEYKALMNYFFCFSVSRGLLTRILLTRGLDTRRHRDTQQHD